MASSFKNYITNAVGDSNTSIYAPSGVTSTVIGLTMANLTASDVKVRLFLNSGGANGYIIYDATVPAGSALVAAGGDQKIVLESGDTLYAYANTATSVDVIVSALEIS